MTKIEILFKWKAAYKFTDDFRPCEEIIKAVDQWQILPTILYADGECAGDIVRMTDDAGKDAYPFFTRTKGNHQEHAIYWASLRPYFDED